MFTVCFRRDSCEVECNCHLFEFRGIVCKHAISALVQNDVSLLPKKYVLRQWRRDVSRQYMRVPTTYDGLVCTVEQVRYEQLCSAFTKMADLVARNEERSKNLLRWIEFRATELALSKCNSIEMHGFEDTNDANIYILDPKFTKRKDAPKKLRKKSPLETHSKKSKGRKKAPVNSDVANTSMFEDAQVHNVSSSHVSHHFGMQGSTQN
ncbi:protein FAR-RED ELONGATED HYPOCOTYL 3-like [Olea europaea var. sylvestris]|uniref:protein FAR-RED ELONGATED HYPOCOTYL 3-like n=1 Tax=Olea europaea var. sylvestris TaxID=158386 RepID=UPI000C1CD833|nr:protein FAR-RED ELONGATED HYPOCOTYL 3-like [Olea europaea var. sylvestris]XP_022886216.1 protein FAR-RED ELONGATED HYPOCOTYL 3-like [Olea europaea var. sylvestris]